MSVTGFGVFGIVIVLLLVMAGFLLKGKGSFLIAGYNTMSKEEKEKYDTKGLCRFVGWLLIVCSLAMALFPVGIYFEIYWLTYCGSALMLVGTIGAVIYANTGKRFRKDDNSKVSNVFENEKSKNTPKTNKIILIGFSIIVLLAISGTLLYGAKEPTVNVFEDSIQIKAMYGLDIDFSDVTKVTLIEKSMSAIGVGMRVNGFDGFGESLKGHFKSDSSGESLLFVHANASPTIRIERSNEKDIYISFRNGGKTQSLFNEFNTVMNRNSNSKE
ncbi:MAG: DUF3784 domain-containing protein [Nitrososphaerota archaeon]|jgi:hypothetical protein|nr:DUF3784 domain-containing protein [Nitrososphaerota archaeon]